jgi:hypothetical protein
MTFYNPQTQEYEHVGSPIQWQDKLWRWLCSLARFT